MTDQEKIDRVIYLIEQSDLDQTIKDILVRDLKAEGLTDFLREQIKAYCMQGIQKLDERISLAKAALEEQPQNPA